MSSTAASRAQATCLPYFPITLLTCVMGLSGGTLAWGKLDSPFAQSVTSILAAFASLALLAVTLTYLLKLALHLDHAREEWQHPVRQNFFSGFSISLLLMASIWHQNPELSLWCWGLGALLQLCVALLLINRWLSGGNFKSVHLSPTWFIPIVGNILVPVAGVPLGFVEISWFFFAFGLVFWVILLTLLLQRLFFEPALPQRLEPSLFILLAPPSIGFLAYTSLIGNVDAFARVLYYTAVFLALVLLMRTGRFLRLPFFLSSWAFSFPVAALTLATTKMAHMTHNASLENLALGLLGLLSGILLWLVTRTLMAFAKGQVCIPE